MLRARAAGRVHGISALAHLHRIRDRGGVVVLDGAMGTELQARGAAMDDAAWCGLVNIRDPGLVRSVHEDHIRAGADVVITNTFMSGVGPMQRAGAGDAFATGIANAVGAAREAVATAASRPIVIAGSVGATPWGAPPLAGGDTAAEAAQLRAGYARQVELLVEGGVDVIALEMVTDARLGRAAVEAALGFGLPVWLGLSMRVPERGAREYQALPAIGEEAAAVVAACLHPDLDAVNVMHTEIDDVSAALAFVAPRWPGPLGAYPHHGRWERPHWTFLDVPDAQLVERARAWMEQGATMLGGCCGLTSHHIAALRALVEAGGRQ